MGFLNASCTMTRFRIVDPVPAELWGQIPEKLRQYAFQDIDDILEERAWGWVSFDDMLDNAWRTAPPEKAAYLAFALRLDTRRIPPAVLKKHTLIALRKEGAVLREQGKKFISRARKLDIREQVKQRLLQRFLPIPAIFDVIWSLEAQRIYLASGNNKIVDLFMQHFKLTFELALEPLTPASLAEDLLGENIRPGLDQLAETAFIG